MESIAVAKTIASKEGYRISPDRELVGLGAANAVAAFLGGYPVTGGFSRSAVNHRAGAVTPLAGVITAGLVTLALLVLTPLFRPMPKAALAAVILVAVASLVDFGELARLWRLKRPDAAVWLTTFVAALVLGSEKGIAVGVGLSLVVFVRRSARPHMAELGYVEDHDAYLNVERFPSARTYEGVYILRVDASMYFANAAHLEDHLRGVAADREDLEHIVLDLAGVNDMDSSALHSLEELLDDLGEAGVALHLAGAKGPVRDLLERASGLSSHDLKTEYQTVGDVLGEITG
jgi:SulP family sulfate permease